MKLKIYFMALAGFMAFASCTDDDRVPMSRCTIMLSGSVPRPNADRVQAILQRITLHRSMYMHIWPLPARCLWMM